MNAVIVNHKYTDGKVLYQVLDLSGDKKDTTWYARDELKDSQIINYYKKRIKSREDNLKLIPKGVIQNPLSVMNHFDPPEGYNEDTDFFSSFLISKPVFLNDLSLNNFGIEKVEALPDISDDQYKKDQNKNILSEQQQMMITSSGETVFVSPSCLACNDQNIFLQIFEKKNEMK